jgi:hypothetical protein
MFALLDVCWLWRSWWNRVKCAWRLAEQARVSPIACVGRRMDGMLLLRCLHLRGILMQPVHADLAETRASHTGIYQRNQLWWHTALERLTQHGLLDTSLLQAQRFLPSLFFLLLPLVFLGLCDEPMPHGLLLAVPLVWWLWDYAQGLIEGSSSRRRRRWWRWWWLSARVRQGHGRRRR